MPSEAKALTLRLREPLLLRRDDRRVAQRAGVIGEHHPKGTTMIIMKMVGLAAIIITALGGALALGSLTEKPSSVRERRLGSNSGIITGIGCAAFCGWRILVDLVEINEVWIGDGAIFSGAACMLVAIAMRIGGALLDPARSSEPQQSVRSTAGWILNNVAAVTLGTALLIQSLTSVGSA